MRECVRILGRAGALRQPRVLSAQCEGVISRSSRDLFRPLERGRDASQREASYLREGCFWIHSFTLHS